MKIELTPQQVKALEAVINYIEETEHGHYDESTPEEQKNHVYRNMEVLRGIVASYDQEVLIQNDTA
jgi:hypothetical protein